MRQVAVIMAGGAGTRLWPLSRASRPKQLLRIVGGRSLLREAYDRLRYSMPAEDIYVITLSKYLPAVAEELSAMPPANLIGEPMGRDTANAIALAAAILHDQDPDTTMCVFTADHLIRSTEAFTRDLKAAIAAVDADPAALVTFGIQPTEPHTGLGYIQRGEPVTKTVFRVASFKEKPDLATAAAYVKSGQYYWNSGMFVWRTRTILEEIARRLPETHDTVTRLAKSWHTTAGPSLAADAYPSLKRISIDFAVMEHATNVKVVESHFEWLDVGSWSALERAVGADDAGNVRSASEAILQDVKSSIIVCEDDHLIAAIGVENIVIVHSDNATLVCHRDRIQEVKDLATSLEKSHEGRYT